MIHLLSIKGLQYENLNSISSSPKKEILSPFLLSLQLFDVKEHSVSYLFLDDNSDLISREMIASFVQLHGGTIIQSPKITRQSPEDKKSNLKWNEEVIWHVAKIRNIIMNFARDHEYDYLFMTDTDLILPIDTLSFLIDAQKDIVSEVFWTKWKSSDFSQNTAQHWLPQVWDNGQYNFDQISAKKNMIRKLKVVPKLLKPGLYKVGGLGACTLFSSKVLHSDLRYHKDETLNLKGEDRHFSVQAQRQGYELWADTNARPLHVFSDKEMERINQFCLTIYTQEKYREIYLACSLLKYYFLMIIRKHVLILNISYLKKMKVQYDRDVIENG